LPVRDQVGFAVAASPQIAAYWIDQLELTALADRRPHELSGGQRRRVGLARALAANPDLLLLDEPLTGLDTPSRDELRRVLRAVLADAGITTVVVTHDPADVAMLADDVAVLAAGTTLQTGPVGDVYRCPASPRVARLLGIPNALAMTVSGVGEVMAADGTVFPANTFALAPGSPVVAMINPAAVRLGHTGQPATVVDVVEFPTHRAVEVRAGRATTLAIHAPLDDGDSHRLRPKDRVMLMLTANAVRLSVPGDREPGALRLDRGGAGPATAEVG
jgi:ABC-type sulfate/molybdate transport systems ATPase subunit